MPPWFGFLNLLVLTCMLFPCQGVVYPPSGGKVMTFLPGSTGRIQWTFDDKITAGTIRTWSFKRTGSSTREALARIFGNGNAVILASASDPVIEAEKPATLVLKNVNQSYDGKYTFEVEEKSISNFEVVVFIAEKPTVSLNCSSPVTLTKGDNFACRCRGEGGNPPANVTWYKDGVKFSAVETEKQTLNFLNVAGADIGIYNCEATSYPHENYTDEKSCEVLVHFSPANTVIAFSQNPAVFGRSLSVICTSDGFPEPSYAIFHNDTKINSCGNLYFIRNVKRKDAGKYKCIANNSLGKDSHSVFLKVTETPRQTTRSIKSSKNESPLSSTASMMTANPVATTTCISIFTTTCTLTTIPTTTLAPPTGNGAGKCLKECSRGTEWYIIIVTLLCGFIFGIILSCVVFRVRRKQRRPKHSNPEPQTSRIDTTYQELDLTKMNKEDNYQSLRGKGARIDAVNNDESNYAELNKTRDDENNYQSLT